jgi:hypothetical protein
MLKKLIIGGLSAVVVIALGTSAYNFIANSAAPDTASAAAPVGTQIDSTAEEANPAWQDSGPVVGSGGQAAQNGGPAWSNSDQSTVQGAQGATRGGRGRGRGGAAETSPGQGAPQAVPDPQNGYQEWQTFQGVVGDYAPPNFTLILENGEVVPAQLGNLNYVNSLGLTLELGQVVTVTGYYDPSGSLAVGQITLDPSGETFTLRDNYGRPVWGGGPNR